MRTRPAVACALLLGIVLWIGRPASAHRLDEYLQDTTITVEKDRVQAQMRLTPGVAVSPFVLAGVDTDGDGVLSQAEQRAYAERVLRDLSLRVNGDRLRLRLVSWTFAGLGEMREGRGAIQIEFRADVPGVSRSRRLVFENHHQSQIAVYLAKCLVPRDPAIQITGQNRNFQQSSYQLDYVQAGAGPAPPSVAPWAGAAALLLCMPFALLLKGRAQGRSGRKRGEGAN